MEFRVERADVIVVGGGIAGMALALALASEGIETVCLDREAPRAMTAEAFDGRSTAIAYGSRKILEGLDLWSALDPHAQPMTGITVIDQGGRGRLVCDERDMGGHPFGWNVENRIIRAHLLDRVKATPALRHEAPAMVTGLRRVNRGVEVTLDDGRRFAAPLVVGADGRGSPTRSFARVPVLEWRYRQNALVFGIRHERPHGGMAVEHYRRPGPFATVPLVDDDDGTPRSAIVWTERPDLARAYHALDQAEFDAEVQKRTGDWLGAVHQIGRRFVYPLGLMHARRHGAERVALVGEAAHVVHPLGAQGLNAGLRDGAVLAEEVVDALRAGADHGGRQVIQRYDRRRRRDNFTLCASTDLLNRLFSNDRPGLRLLRNAGLGIANMSPTLRKGFMDQTMGVRGDQPRLARGLPL